LAKCFIIPGLEVLDLALAWFFGSSGSFDSAAATATAALLLARARLPNKVAVTAALQATLIATETAATETETVTAAAAATATAALCVAVGRATATVAGLGLPWLGGGPVLCWVLGKDVARVLWLAAWLWGGVAARGWARGASADAGPAGAEVAWC